MTRPAIVNFLINDMENFEKQWAVALKRAKIKSQIPLALREENLSKEIAYWKEELKRRIFDKDIVHVRQVYNQLTKLLATLCIVKIQRIRANEIPGFENDVIKKYFSDGAKLSLIIDKLK